MNTLDHFRLDGKVAVVTGASSGLGFDFARGLAEAGADVVVAARRRDGLERAREMVEGQGRRCVSHPCDVSSVEDCNRLVETAVGELGSVDVLINNAGVSGAAPATREDPEHFRKIVDVNLHGSYWMAQACGRKMPPGSSIVNVSSILAKVSIGIPQAAYAASKAAILGLTVDLARQWTGRKGIRVNALLPGYFPSEMTAKQPPEDLERIASQTVIGRLGRPAELTSALVFLASDASSYVTGTGLTVDGGLVISS